MGNLLFPDLTRRSEESELMDLPDADEKKLLKTIREFSVLNALFSGSRKLIKRFILPLMDTQSTKTYSILDIGSGGCDIPIWIVKKARRLGIRVQITALDSDARIQRLVKEAVKDYPEIRPVQGNAFDIDRYGPFDFIISNHFLHHLEDESIPQLLASVARNSRRAFLLNDLRRSRWAYIGYTIFTGLLFNQSLAYYDGRLSIRKGFLQNELVEHMQKAGIGTKATVIAAFPSRLAIFGDAGGKKE